MKTYNEEKFNINLINFTGTSSLYQLYSRVYLLGSQYEASSHVATIGDGHYNTRITIHAACLKHSLAYQIIDYLAFVAATNMNKKNNFYAYGREDDGTNMPGMMIEKQAYLVFDSEAEKVVSLRNKKHYEQCFQKEYEKHLKK